MSTKTFSWFGQNNATAEETLAFAQNLIDIVNKSKQNQLVFEIAPVELERKLNWNDAIEYCESIGWRLPTIEELKEIYKNDRQKSISDFNCGYYWSSTVETDNTYNDANLIAYQHWIKGGGIASKGLKTQLLRVRPIRDYKII
jgi:hypothetical protein